jgi:hypothetical protein
LVKKGEVVPDIEFTLVRDISTDLKISASHSSDQCQPVLPLTFSDLTPSDFDLTQTELVVALQAYVDDLDLEFQTDEANAQSKLAELVSAYLQAFADTHDNAGYGDGNLCFSADYIAEMIMAGIDVQLDDWELCEL